MRITVTADVCKSDCLVHLSDGSLYSMSIDDYYQSANPQVDASGRCLDCGEVHQVEIQREDEMAHDTQDRKPAPEGGRHSGAEGE